jgi:hypothetical protein
MSVEFSGPERVACDIDGDNLAAVAEAISRKDEAGKAEWVPRYDYQVTGSNLSSVTVTWSGYGSARQAEKDEWDRFLAALETHEQGHIDLVVKYLSNIDEQMIGQSLDAAKQAWENALAALQSASDAYDRQSDHGRNQGTIIDVSVGMPTPAAGA